MIIAMILGVPLLPFPSAALRNKGLRVGPFRGSLDAPSFRDAKHRVSTADCRPSGSGTLQAPHASALRAVYSPDTSHEYSIKCFAGMCVTVRYRLNIVEWVPDLYF